MNPQNPEIHGTHPPLDKILEKSQNILSGKDNSVDYATLKNYIERLVQLIEGRTVQNIEQSDIDDLHDLKRQVEQYRPQLAVTESIQSKIEMQRPRVMHLIQEAIDASQELLKRKKEEEQKAQQVEVSTDLDPKKYILADLPVELKASYENASRALSILIEHVSASGFETGQPVLRREHFNKPYAEAISLIDGILTTSKDLPQVLQLHAAGLTGGEQNNDKRRLISSIVVVSVNTLINELTELRAELKAEGIKQYLQDVFETKEIQIDLEDDLLVVDEEINNFSDAEISDAVQTLENWKIDIERMRAEALKNAPAFFGDGDKNLLIEERFMEIISRLVRYIKKLRDKSEEIKNKETKSKLEAEVANWKTNWGGSTELQEINKFIENLPYTTHSYNEFLLFYTDANDMINRGVNAYLVLIPNTLSSEAQKEIKQLIEGLFAQVRKLLSEELPKLAVKAWEKEYLNSRSDYLVAESLANDVVRARDARTEIPNQSRTKQFFATVSWLRDILKQNEHVTNPVKKALRERVMNILNNWQRAEKILYEDSAYYAIEVVNKYCSNILITTPEVIGIKNDYLRTIENVKNEQLKVRLKVKVFLHELQYHGDTGKKDFATYLPAINDMLRNNTLTYLDIARALFVQLADNDPEREVGVDQIDQQAENELFNEGCIEMWNYAVDRIAGRIDQDPADQTDDDFQYAVLVEDRTAKFRRHLEKKFADKIRDPELLQLMITYCHEMGAKSLGYIPWLARETTRSHGTSANKSTKFSDELAVLAPWAFGSYSRRRYGASVPDATSEDMLFLTQDILSLWNTPPLKRQYDDEDDRKRALEARHHDMEEMHELQDIVVAYREMTWRREISKIGFVNDIRRLFAPGSTRQDRIDPDRSIFPIQGEVAINAINTFRLQKQKEREEKVKAESEGKESKFKAKPFYKIFDMHDPDNYDISYAAVDKFFNIFKEPLDTQHISQHEVESRFQEWMRTILGKAKLIPGRHQLLFGPFTVRYIHRLLDAYEFQHQETQVLALIKHLLHELHSSGGVSTLKGPDGVESLYDYVKRNVTEKSFLGLERPPGEFVYVERPADEKRYKVRLDRFRNKFAVGLASVSRQLPEGLRVWLVPGDVVDPTGNPIEIEPPWAHSSHVDRDTTEKGKSGH